MKRYRYPLALCAATIFWILIYSLFSKDVSEKLFTPTAMILLLSMGALFWFGVYMGERIGMGKQLFRDKDERKDDEEDFDIWDLSTLD